MNFICENDGAAAIDDGWCTTTTATYIANQFNMPLSLLLPFGALVTILQRNIWIITLIRIGRFTKSSFPPPPPTPPPFSNSKAHQLYATVWMFVYAAVLSVSVCLVYLSLLQYNIRLHLYRIYSPTKVYALFWIYIYGIFFFFLLSCLPHSLKRCHEMMLYVAMPATTTTTTTRATATKSLWIKNFFLKAFLFRMKIYCRTGGTWTQVNVKQWPRFVNFATFPFVASQVFPSFQNFLQLSATLKITVPLLYN